MADGKRDVLGHLPSRRGHSCDLLDRELAANRCRRRIPLTSAPARAGRPLDRGDDRTHLAAACDSRGRGLEDDRPCRSGAARPVRLRRDGEAAAPVRGDVAPRGGACRRPCRSPLRRVRHRLRAHAGGARAQLLGDRARGADGSARAPPPVRPAGRGLHVHAAALPGTAMNAKGQPGHRTTTAHIQAAYPFVAEGGLGGRGVYVGRDVYGGSFCYDPWELYGRELTSPNAVVVGIVGRAKSSLVKTYVFRQSVFGRQAWIVDVKGEYDSLAQALGVRPIALSPGGAVRLNPLTPRGGAERQLNLLYSVAAAALERPLTPEEKRSAQEALVVLANRSPSEPTLPHVVEVLLHPPAEMADALAMRVDELAVSVRPMAFALDQLCSGNLRGMFDGPTTRGLDLDAPLVVLNLRAVLNTHTTALGILMTCATAWLQAMIETETDERSAKRIVVVDEAWRILSNLGIGEWLQQSFKLSRGLGAQNVVVMHRLSDLRATGAEGSREVRLAEGLLADAETKIIYAQPPDQLPQTRELLGLTDTEAELLPHLRRGWALWKVGQRSFLVQHRLSPFEHEFVDTDARMAVRRAA